MKATTMVLAGMALALSVGTPTLSAASGTPRASVREARREAPVAVEVAHRGASTPTLATPTAAPTASLLQDGHDGRITVVRSHGPVIAGILDVEDTWIGTGAAAMTATRSPVANALILTDDEAAAADPVVTVRNLRAKFLLSDEPGRDR